MGASIKQGKLYGLGVGPGDPKLLTVRAVEVLGAVSVVFAAGSSKNEYSLALNIASGYLPEGVEVQRLDFPMTSDQAVLDSAWEDNARRVLAVLDGGRDAAFVTLGDPLTYSTFGYLLRTVRALDPGVEVESVPGVTAFAAAAARLNLPLVESKESLMVVSGVGDVASEIPRLAACGDNLVIMKTYKNFDQILETIEDLPGRRDTFLVSQCGLPGERVETGAAALKGQKMPYLSLVLVKSRREE